MKLSMWMIANRLSSLDLKLDIRDSAPAVLKSARRVYATNCVHVYRDGEDVVCNGEGDTIRIPNMDLLTGFELVQGVFDYFQDWLDELLQMVRDRNYQGIVDLVWQVCRNPIILMDGNNRVLGITRQYPDNSLDEEWNYLCNYGYASINAVLQMRSSKEDLQMMQHGVKVFQFPQIRALEYGGCSYCMTCNDVICGRITLLNKEREINPGDFQIIELVAGILEPCLGQIYYEGVINNTNVFYNLLTGKSCDREMLDAQLSYHQWNIEDTYYMTLIEMQENADKKSMDRNIDMLIQTLMYHSGNYVAFKKTPYIVLLSNSKMNMEGEMLTFLTTLKTHNPIKISFSLPCHGILNIEYLYRQTLYALNSGKKDEPDKKLYDFFDYALNYIIETGSLDDSVRACMPTVVKLWIMQQKQGDDLFLTLKTYLDYERSVTKTSECLFTHRNTVLYRIKKIQEILRYNLNDPYVREYCRMSIRVLEYHALKSKEL